MITIRTDFGTDNGPPCPLCKGTIYTYDVSHPGHVNAQCNGCHAYAYIAYMSVKPPTTAAEISALHRMDAEVREYQKATSERFGLCVHCGWAIHTDPCNPV